MASNRPESVPKIIITGSRLDATVILGATRYGLVVDPSDPDLVALSQAVIELRRAVLLKVKSDLSMHLQQA